MATNMARRMVTEWGMSDKLGPLRYTSDQEEVFLGHSVSQSKNMSDETAKLVDAEVRLIVEEGYDKAKEILTKYIDQLHSLAKALLEYETLTGDEIRALMRGEPIIRVDDGFDPDAGKPKSSVPKTGGLGGMGGSGELPQGT